MNIYKDGITYPVQSTAAQIIPGERRVFVYGSLRRGGAMGDFLQQVATWKGAYRTVKPFRLHSLQAFPAAVPGGDTPIIGEVYELTDGHYFRYLDKMEGTARGLYRRVPVEVVDSKGRTAIVFMYVWGDIRLNAPIIPSGDWFDEAVRTSE